MPKSATKLGMALAIGLLVAGASATGGSDQSQSRRSVAVRSRSGSGAFVGLVPVAAAGRRGWLACSGRWIGSRSRCSR